jgi:hypothetical protein
MDHKTIMKNRKQVDRHLRFLDVYHTKKKKTPLMITRLTKTLQKMQRLIDIIEDDRIYAGELHDLYDDAKRVRGYIKRALAHNSNPNAPVPHLPDSTRTETKQDHGDV